MSERDTLQSRSQWYLREQLDIDRRLIEFRYRSIRQYLRGPLGLELGSAEGWMTHLLLPHFEHLTSVDAASDLIERIADVPTLTKVVSLLEEYDPGSRFDTIVLDHVLEHVLDPVTVLRRARAWLRAEGRLVIGVPNGRSLHRRVGVALGLLRNWDDFSERDRQVGHRRVYDRGLLQEHLAEAGLRPEHVGGIFLKPLSNSQIEQSWSRELIEAFYEVGKELPEMAAEIFAVSVPVSP